MAGLRFGRCESLFRIASGGMAEVFAARLCGEAGFSKLVAVKRVLPVLGGDDAFTRMFLEEARVAAQLASPHIVQTLDVGRADGRPFMVQELVIGVDLVEVVVAARRAGAAVPIDVALELLAQAAVGLHDAHEARTAGGRALELVHRDVSPHNLLVGVDGRVRLTDFGVARVAFDRLVATQTGTMKGKLAYLSPEQIAGQPLDRRADVFGLGVVAWETLAADRLFARDTQAATLDAVRSAPIPPLERLRPDAPPAAVAVIARALERDASRRLSSARTMADELRRAGREAQLDLSDTRVAAYVRELAPPRLTALEQRLRAFAAEPTIETLPDIDLPAPDSLAETEIVDDVATEVEAPRPTRAPHEADTVVKEREPGPALAARRNAQRVAREHGHWLVPALMVAVGVLLAAIALLLVRGAP